MRCVGRNGRGYPADKYCVMRGGKDAIGRWQEQGELFELGFLFEGGAGQF